MSCVLVPVTRFCSKPSTQIAAIGYVPDDLRLYVEFHPRSGVRSIYPYTGVEPAVANGLVRASSTGGFFNTAVKAHPQLYPTIKGGLPADQIADNFPHLATGEPLPDWLASALATKLTPSDVD